MKRKFKHYGTEQISELEVKDSHVKIEGKWHKLESHDIGVRAIGTSWVIYND